MFFNIYVIKIENYLSYIKHYIYIYIKNKVLLLFIVI